MLHSPIDDRVTHHADTVRVCNRDRAFEKATFFDPRGARHLPVAVQTENAGINGIVFLPARQNRGHPGSNRSLPDLEFALATDQRGVTNLNTSDVGDRVEFSRRPVKWNAKRARAHVLRRRRRSLRLSGEKRRNKENGKRESGETWRHEVHGKGKTSTE